MLPRDRFLALAEEAIAAASGTEVGQKSELFGTLWQEDDPKFCKVKEQYQKMLSSTPDTKATAWREKVGIEEATTDDVVEVDNA